MAMHIDRDGVRSPAPARPSTVTGPGAADRAGMASEARPQIRALWRVVGVLALFLILVAPIVIGGGLLADEYIICLRPVHEGGYGPYLRAIWRDTGIVRPAR